jgi:predicted nucleic acid-binding protein
MSDYDDILWAARSLSPGEQQQLARELGAPASGGAGRTELPLTQFPGMAGPRPHSVAWVKAERGHAVLATETAEADAAIPAGAEAIAGIWADRASSSDFGFRISDLGTDRSLSNPKSQGPALLATDLCVELALGRPEAIDFFREPAVEIRLSTVTYLALLSQARDPDEQRRIRRFVSPYPVLSLGPMASSRAVELLLEYGPVTGLGPLDALAAATAFAHEIPIFSRDPVFQGIADLEFVAPY